MLSGKVVGSDKRSFAVEDVLNSQNDKAHATSPENFLEGLIKHFKRQKPTGLMVLDAVVSDGSKLAFIFIEVKVNSRTYQQMLDRDQLFWLSAIFTPDITPRLI